VTQRFGDDPQSIPGARIIAKAIIKTYAAGTHKADVQLVGSHPTIITAIRVATDIPAADVVAGRQCTVLFLDPANQDDAVILTIQGALPSGGGGGGGTASDTVVSETTFGLTPAPGIATPYSRGDHTHGSPTDPVTAHVAAADPHTVYGALAQAETWAALQTFNAGIQLAANQQIKDSGGAGRILLTASGGFPLAHITLTGNTKITGYVYMKDATVPLADAGGLYIKCANNIAGAYGLIADVGSFVSGVPAGQVGLGGRVIPTGATALGDIYGLDFVAGSGNTSALANVAACRVMTYIILSTTGLVTNLTGFLAQPPQRSALGTQPTNIRGVWVQDAGGNFTPTNAIGVDIDTISGGTNRYGLRIADIAAGTIARLLELGPTPYLRLLGSGNWTPTANQTPLYLAEGATPTLRQLQWKAGNALVAGDKVLVLV